MHLLSYFVLALSVAMTNVSFASQPCDVKPFQEEVITKQSAVWKDAVDYVAETAGIEISSYNATLKITNSTRAQTVFQFKIDLRSSNGADIMLVTRFLKNGGDYHTTLERSFAVTGKEVKTYGPDGTLVSHKCESQLSHFDPSFPPNFVDYWLVNKQTNVVVGNLGWTGLNYLYCLRQGHTEALCRMGIVTSPITYQFYHLLQEASLSSYDL